MSTFGSPGGQAKHFKPTPPQRGSFPLDHYAECKDAMKAYLACMKSARSVNDVCREQAKTYLKCRMDHNLMAPDTMKNLGFHDENSGGPKSQEQPAR